MISSMCALNEMLCRGDDCGSIEVKVLGEASETNEGGEAGPFHHQHQPQSTHMLQIHESPGGHPPFYPTQSISLWQQCTKPFTVRLATFFFSPTTTHGGWSHQSFHLAYLVA